MNETTRRPLAPSPDKVRQHAHEALKALHTVTGPLQEGHSQAVKHLEIIMSLFDYNPQSRELPKPQPRVQSPANSADHPPMDAAWFRARMAEAADDKQHPVLRSSVIGLTTDQVDTLCEHLARAVRQLLDETPLQAPRQPDRW